MIVYTTERSKQKKKKKSRVQLEAEKYHAEFLKSVGYTGKKHKNLPKQKQEFTPRPTYPVKTSDLIPPGVICAKKSIDDWKWKKNITEKPETVEEIERKKKRVAIAYNKGSYQYITDNDDTTAIGK